MEFTIVALIIGAIVYFLNKTPKNAAEIREFLQTKDVRTTPTQDYDMCRKAAIRAGALDPQGLEGFSANWRSWQQGQSWADSPLAQRRLKAGIVECMRRKGYSDAEIQVFFQ